MVKLQALCWGLTFLLSSSHGRRCHEACACNMSIPTWTAGNSDLEWCTLAAQTDDSRPCAFPNGRVRETGLANEHAPCHLVSGRHVVLQNSVQTRRASPTERCSPPMSQGDDSNWDIYFRERESCLRTISEYGERVLQAFDTDVIQEDSTLREFGKALEAAGFTESALHIYTGQISFFQMSAGSTETNLKGRPNAIELCDDKDRLCHLINIFVRGLPALLTDLRKLGLPDHVVRHLFTLGILVRSHGLFFSVIAVYPVEGIFVFTDFVIQNEVRVDQPVMALGMDSRALAALIVSTLEWFELHGDAHVQWRSLDVCTGSGVQALVVANVLKRRGLVAPHLTLVDINPRTRRFAHANGVLNGIDIQYILGDMLSFDVTERGPFDMITANPPFWPQIGHEQYEAYKHGGKNGFEVTQRVMTLAYKLLKVGGWLYVVTPLYGVYTMASRMHEWGFGNKQVRVFYDEVINAKKAGYALCYYGSEDLWKQCARYLRSLGYKSVSLQGAIIMRNCAGSILTASEIIPSLWFTLSGCGRGNDWSNCVNNSASNKEKADALRTVTDVQCVDYSDDLTAEDEFDIGFDTDLEL